MNGRWTLIGRGRAGGSLAGALDDLGWELVRQYGRHDDPTDAAADVDLCVIATPDSAIASVAGRVHPADAVVMHLSGVTGLDALAGHRAAALHPLVALPDAARGGRALRQCWFAVAGEPLATDIAEALSGRWFAIADQHRALYHAAAAAASNHLVGLMGHVERLAAVIDVPPEALVHLARGALDNVGDIGAAQALTGPAQRGDHATINVHRTAIELAAPDELATYDALLEATQRLIPPSP